MNKFFHLPQNVAIIRENAIAGIIVLLIMGFVGPFKVDELDNSRFLYFILMALSVFVIGCLVGFFTCYVLKMPHDPSLPLRTIQRNCLVQKSRYPCHVSILLESRVDYKTFSFREPRMMNIFNADKILF